MPLNGVGTVETNLNKYKGNILKSNFQHYAMYECGLFQGELEFLMAKEASQTLSKHYLDFRNSEIQMIIWEKLNRLPYIFSKQKKSFKKYCNNGVTNIVSCNDGQANLKIEVEFEEKLQILIRNNYGFNVEVVEVIDDEID